MPLIKYRRYRPNHAAVMVPTPVSGYQGPGDIVSGATVWWGLRAYNAAYATGSNPAIDITDQSNNNPLTVNILSNGSLDVASVSSWVTANSVSSILIKQLYDQTGGGHHAVQNTALNRPALILSGLGSLPVIRGNRTNGSYLNVTLGGAVSQPFTTSNVAKRTSAFTSEHWLGGDVISQVALWGWTNQADKVKFHAGTNGITATATDNNWHALQFVFNGSSSDINVDGSVNTLNPNTNSLAASFRLFSGAGQGDPLGGDCTEIGIWQGVAFSSTQSTNMKNNQQGYWNY